MPNGIYPFRTPELLNLGHNVAAFRCSDDALTRWFVHMARESHRRDTARTYVTTPEDEPHRVAGFYSLSATSMTRESVPSDVGQRMPEPIPSVLLGRLAVSVDFAGTGRGLGKDLVFDAMRRSAFCCCWDMGAAMLIVRAKSEHIAERLYRPAGFRDTNRPNVLYNSLKTIRTSDFNRPHYCAHPWF